MTNAWGQLMCTIVDVYFWVHPLIHQGGLKHGKHGKPGKLREFEKFFKCQGKLGGNLNFCRKAWKTQARCKVCVIIANENVFRRIFLS